MARLRKKLPTTEEMVELLNNRVLVSHAVTLMPDDYIKKSVTDFLTSYLLQKIGIVVVNEDPKNLETSMLMSSFQHPDDLALLLHGCVSSTQGLKISTSSEKSLSAEEEARKKTEAELHNCSLDQIIEHVKDSAGMPRIKFYAPPDDPSAPITNPAFYKAIQIGPFIRVEKPAEIDYSHLDFSHITTDAALDVFLKDIIKYESGLSDTLDIGIDLFDPIVVKVFGKMVGWQELAIKEAKNSAYNNISFDVVNDPWATLFNGL